MPNFSACRARGSPAKKTAEGMENNIVGTAGANSFSSTFISAIGVVDTPRPGGARFGAA